MSGGYADRLKAYPNKGVCGLPEKYDNERRLAASLREVVNAVREAQHLVIFTGAGISTAAGIPDFRGPTGIWTQEKAREKVTYELQRVAVLDKVRDAAKITYVDALSPEETARKMGIDVDNLPPEVQLG